MCFLEGFFKDDLRKYWRKKWQHAPGFLPENFHGQESLVGPWAHKPPNTKTPTSKTYVISITLGFFTASTSTLTFPCFTLAIPNTNY